MKDTLVTLISQALTSLEIPHDLDQIGIERTRDPAHGDFASNVAMRFAKQAKQPPRELAAAIMAALPSHPTLSGTEIAGPGFINFRLNDDAARQVVSTVLAQTDQYGLQDATNGPRVQIEFVSANPTGPLHVGHGRGAAYGASLANLLAATGKNIEREYYVNDAGRQMDILAASVWFRYLQACGETLPFPSNGYQGDYILDIAADMQAEHGTQFVHPSNVVLAPLPADENEGGDKDQYIDAVINQAKNLLGEDGYLAVHAAGLNNILADIKADLADFGVTFQHWYSERSLSSNNAIQNALNKLADAGHTYELDGAIWFKSTTFGDEKDRVLVRDNGQSTYFASDVAYHLDKFERGYDQVINIWGSDHHGYVPRVQAAIQALGVPANFLVVQLVQFAVLWRGGEKAPMSTRSGQFVTLKELREEVGNDAARLFYVLRSCDQHMDFDIDLARSQSNDNPVYYLQYAHARVCSVFRQVAEKGYSYDQTAGLQAMACLTSSYEEAVMTELDKYPEMLQSAAASYAPHRIANYLNGLAQTYHSWYNAQVFIVADDAERNARLCLNKAVQQVLQNGFKLLGIQAPESM